MKIVELSGPAHKRGEQHGRQNKEGIHCYLEGLYSAFAGHGWSRARARREAGKYIPFVEHYSQEIAEEIRGIAEGSERKTEEIMMVVAFYEICDRLRLFGSGRGCTGFAVGPSATATGEAYIGQNYDREFGWDTTKYLFLLRVKPSSGPSIMGWTYPGQPPTYGVNSRGIATCWQTPHSGERKLGVPAFVIVAEMLRQKSIGEALSR